MYPWPSRGSDPGGFGPWETLQEHVELALRKSLTDLRLDYVDLYLIHFPISLKVSSTGRRQTCCRPTAAQLLTVLPGVYLRPVRPHRDEVPSRVDLRPLEPRAKDGVRGRAHQRDMGRSVKHCPTQ